jgi:hypothetical protein
MARQPIWEGHSPMFLVARPMSFHTATNGAGGICPPGAYIIRDATATSRTVAMIGTGEQPGGPRKSASENAPAAWKPPARGPAMPLPETKVRPTANQRAAGQ